MQEARIVAAAALWVCASCACAATENIVKNPGFEAGSADWTVNGTFLTQLDPRLVHGGSHAMISGCIGDRCVESLGSGFFLRQALPTTPGETYDLSFWTYGGSGIAQYSVFWNGVLVDLQTLASGQMLQHEYAGLVASSDVTMLELHGRDDPTFMSFDDVVVQRSAALVPEPGIWAMLLAGLGLAGWARRRRR